MQGPDQAVVVLVEARAKPGCLGAVVEAMRGSQAHSQDWPGCRQFVVTVAQDQPDVVVVVERWDSARAHKQAVTQVLATDGYAQFRQLLSQDLEWRYLREE